MGFYLFSHFNNVTSLFQVTLKLEGTLLYISITQEKTYIKNKATSKIDQGKGEDFIELQNHS